MIQGLALAVSTLVGAGIATAVGIGHTLLLIGPIDPVHFDALVDAKFVPHALRMFGITALVTLGLAQLLPQARGGGDYALIGIVAALLTNLAPQTAIAVHQDEASQFLHTIVRPVIVFSAIGAAMGWAYWLIRRPDRDQPSNVTSA